MKKDLIITDIGYEKAIINAIRDVQKMDRKVIKLGIPKQVAEELTPLINGRRGLKVIRELYGIPVDYTKTLQTTYEFSRFTK